MNNSIPRDIRQNIFDGLDLEDISYSGRLSDTEFLGRLFDLSELPSNDSRFSDAAGDIWQHCENNFDWEGNWVFSDSRFQLYTCPDVDFLQFLCEMVHPLVRESTETSNKLAEHFNDQLRNSGWELVEIDRIAGRSRYGAQKLGEFHSKISRAKTAAEILSSNWMQTEIDRINNSIESDPALAIGTSKDLVESCCKAILTEMGVPIEKRDDLPKLSKKMCTVLGLAPEGIPSEAKGVEVIRRTLSNLTQMTQGIAELRGLYGSGHGRDGKHVGLEPRHARLAAASAIAFVDFATETYLKRKAI
jgi:hypothetical protein